MGIVFWIYVLNHRISSFIARFKQQLNIEVAEAFKNELKKREELEPTVSVLQQHAQICQNQIKEMQQANKELEQYGSGLCVRTDGFPTVDNETSDEVLDRVKSLIKETSCDISDVVIDRAHRIGKVSMIKKQMFFVKVSLYILQLLGTECFTVVELL